MMPEPLAQAHAACTRRAALARLGAGGVGAALAARGKTAGAQEATPGMAADLPPVVQEYVAAWEALDADRIAETYAEDVVVEDVPAGTTREGREAIRAYLQAFLGAVEDASAQITTAVAAGDRAAVESRLSARYTGQVPGFPPGEGQRITVRGVDVLELAGGRIQRAREYYDLYGVLVQLGLVPPPPARGTPAATPAADLT